MRGLRDEEHLSLALDDSGAVSLGGEHIGKLEGFGFAQDPRAEGIHGRTIRAGTDYAPQGMVVSETVAVSASDWRMRRRKWAAWPLVVRCRRRTSPSRK